MTEVITWVIDPRDGVCIERGRPSTALNPMPAYGALNSGFTVNPNLNKPAADGFLKLGDIKGEFSSKHDLLIGLDTGSGNDRLTGIDMWSPAPACTIYGGGGHNNLNAVTSREDGAGRFTTGGGGDSIINNGGHFEMQGGIDLRSDNRFVFEPLEMMTNLVGTNDSGLDADGGFQPWEVSAVEIGRPPDPKMWLQLLG